MAKRKKTKAYPAPINREEAMTQARRYSEATSKLKEIEAKIEQQQQRIREKFKMEVSELHEELDDSYGRLTAYAEKNKEDLFAKRRSIDLQFGKIGYRIGTPKVKSKATFKDAVGLLKVNGLDNYVRIKEDVDRDKIIASREDAEQMAALAKVGLTVIQDETFFVEPKEEVLAQ